MRTSTTLAPVDTRKDPRWAALLSRDPKADGTFYYSVVTTGVYCYPSCGARLARPEHVRFHTTCEEAERAGYRPCRRCKPDQPPQNRRQTGTVEDICRFIEASEHVPTLGELATRAGLSPYHFHRLFKQVTGLTPRAFATAHRGRRVRNRLTTSRTVTDAMYEAGYRSSGRFYESSNGLLGMTPSDYRTGGAGTDIRFAVGDCSLGSILVAMSERGICAIFLGDDPDPLTRDLQDRFPHAHLIGGDRRFERMVARVVGFVESPTRGLDLPLDIQGTAFQQRVWEALRKIPPGMSVSYRDLARRIGAPQAIRAVGRACATNIIAVAIPCHRVVRTDGTPSGYRWGIERKRSLLGREARS